MSTQTPIPSKDGRPVVIVCGGRDEPDVEGVWKALDTLTPKPWAVITGGAGGVDKFASRWAVKRGILSVLRVASWQKYGRAAGPIRNRTMLDLDPDAVVAFPGGRGTADMVRQATASGVPVIHLKPKLVHP